MYKSDAFADEMLDQDEKEVLYKSSYVEGKAYLPWVESDSTENHNGFKLYNDPDGNLPLSEKQVRSQLRTPYGFCCVSRFPLEGVYKAASGVVQEY